MKPSQYCALLAAACIAIPASASSQPARITTPRAEFGHDFGDDYFLATYRQLSAYWVKLSRESDRMVLDTIGTTAEGRQQLMAIVTSPANHRNLARYKEISRRLALAEGLTDDQARALAREGKTVVWIDGGLHASEVLGAQQLGEMVYQMLSRTDAETMNILDNTIILFVHANPDGHDLLADWYMRNPVPEQRSTAGVPVLYQKYIGHDNNRDFFASTQAESENMNRTLYREWYPQILYNHHQSGPAGTVLWGPPLRDPFNYNQDPLIPLGITQLGNAIHTRLAAEGKPGSTMRSGGPYDGWWNGGLRNTAAFHNVLAILTEMIGSPTPTSIPLVPSRQLPSSDLPFPIAPQRWHFRQSVDYSVSCNRAILDLAARNRENFLFNFYRMGKNSIERGSRDTWTPRPDRVDSATARLAAGGGGAAGRGGGGGGGGRGGGNFARDSANYEQLLRDPAARDPRGFILPSNQPDFQSATRFVNALLETGITVHRATQPFTVAGKQYPAGSYVVKGAQAFRPHVIDMFEPQDHPHVIPYPGASPTRPYDNAGWTLALQMGIEFDRIMDGFDGPFEVIPDWNLPMPAGRVTTTGTRAPVGYFVRHESNDAFRAVNRLLGAGDDVRWLLAPAGTHPAGTFWVAARPTTRALIDRIARETGVSFEGVAERPTGVEAIDLGKPRIGLWDQYGGSMTSGWTRWILEQFEFPFELAFPPTLDAGNLAAKYDVLIFPDGAIPAAGGGRGGGGGGAPAGGGRGAGAGPPADESDIPAQYRGRRGSITAARTIPEIRAMVEQGGTVLAIGSSATNLAAHLGIPVTNHLVERAADGTTREIPASRYFVPGSILRTRVDTTHPLSHGMKARTNVFFDESPVWAFASSAEPAGVKRIAWYDSATPLVSGWALGEQALENGLAVVEVTLGRGRVVLFGPEILQRAQPHGTFKWLFNGIYYGSGGRGRL